MAYVFDAATLGCIYVILAAAYNLQIGISGLFSIAPAAFYGVGAYTTALLTVREGTQFTFALLAALVAAAAASVPLAFLAFRLVGDTLVVASFAIQIAVVAVINNWTSLTEGTTGVSGVSRPDWLGLGSGDKGFLLIAAALMLLAVFVCWVIGASPYGRLLRAIRDDELAASSLGHATARAKLGVFVLTGALCGLAGAIYASYEQFVSAGTFAVDTSVTILAAVLVGGAGRLAGAVLGAIVIAGLPELLQLVQSNTVQLGAIQQISFGGILVVVMMIRPEGLIPARARSRQQRPPNRRRTSSAPSAVNVGAGR